MAKAKYRLGTMVQFTQNDASSGEKSVPQVGIVDGVIARQDGFSYSLEGRMDTVAEVDMLRAYREIKARAPQKRKSKPDKRKHRAADEERATQ